ncbi:hypothetical protein FMUBM48_08010 [Nocardia cyriacigeorgica]|nr:hypothetical protein FMUBM48_08010 [Nocardia cyriacigeorgica]
MRDRDRRSTTQRSPARTGTDSPTDLDYRPTATGARYPTAGHPAARHDGPDGSPIPDSSPVSDQAHGDCKDNGVTPKQGVTL